VYADQTGQQSQAKIDEFELDLYTGPAKHNLVVYVRGAHSISPTISEDSQQHDSTPYIRDSVHGENVSIDELSCKQAPACCTVHECSLVVDSPAAGTHGATMPNSAD
jgi:hypothetical protein